MKIAYITDTEFPTKAANGVQTFRMCEAFVAAGYDLRLFCQGKKEQINQTDLFSYYGVNPGFDTQFISLTGGRLKPYRFTFKLYSQIRKFSPDIVYTRHLHSAYWLALSGWKVMYELHKSPSIDGVVSRLIFQKLVKLVKLQKLVVISNALKNEVQKNFFIPAEKILVAHDGANVTEERDLLVAFPKDRLNIGYLGSAFVGKGVVNAVTLAQRCPNYLFHIIGCEFSEIRNCFKENLPYNLCFYGYVRPAIAKSYLKKMDVLIAPFGREVLDISGRNIVNWMSPLKIFEYMASGKPIVASNLEVISEVLVNNETSLLCEPDNINEWANALNKLAEDVILRERLGANALNELKTKYTWHQRISRIMQ